MDCMNCGELVTYEKTWVKLCLPCYKVLRLEWLAAKNKAKLPYYIELLPNLKNELSFVDRDKAKDTWVRFRKEVFMVETFINKAQLSAQPNDPKISGI